MLDSYFKVYYETRQRRLDSYDAALHEGSIDPFLYPQETISAVVLLFAIAAALIRGGLSEPVAYLLTGAGAAVVSAALIAIGLNRLSGDALKPSVTIDQVQRDKIAAKEMVR